MHFPTSCRCLFLGTFSLLFTNPTDQLSGGISSCLPNVLIFPAGVKASHVADALRGLQRFCGDVKQHEDIDATWVEPQLIKMQKMSSGSILKSRNSVDFSFLTTNYLHGSFFLEGTLI